MNGKMIAAIVVAGCVSCGMLAGCSMLGAQEEPQDVHEQQPQPQPSIVSDGDDSSDAVTIGQEDDSVLSVSLENKLGTDISSVSVKRHESASYPTPLSMSSPWRNDQDATVYLAGVPKPAGSSDSQESSSVYDLAGANAVIFTVGAGGTGLTYSVGSGSASNSQQTTGTQNAASASASGPNGDFDMQITTSDGKTYEIQQIPFDHMRDGEVHLSDDGVAYVSYIDTQDNRVMSTLPQSEQSASQQLGQVETSGEFDQSIVQQAPVQNGYGATGYGAQSEDVYGGGNSATGPAAGGGATATTPQTPSGTTDAGGTSGTGGASGVGGGSAGSGTTGM